jgi:metacaspase-1
MDIDRAYLGIGINHFDNLPGNSLTGCLNDIADSSTEFKPRSRTTIVPEGEATDLNTTIALEILFSTLLNVVPGGHYLAWLSTHGSQRPNAKESDGFDEVIVCKNFKFDGTGCIEDDKIGALMEDVDKKGATPYVIADLCHSAGLTRDIVPWAPRFVANPLCAKQRRASKRRGRGFLGRLFSQGAAIDVDNSFPGVLFSGCDEDGTSADATFNGRPNGAFTYFFLQALRTLKYPTNRQIIEYVTKELKAHGYSQRPHLQCAAKHVDALFFGGWNA